MTLALIRLIVIVACMGTTAASPLSAETANFEGDTVGGPPRGWLLTMTGKGTPKWAVEREANLSPAVNVLKQLGRDTYPLALMEGTILRGGFAEVRFKPISGSDDCAGKSSRAPRTPTTTTSCSPTHSRTMWCSTRP